MAARAIKNTCRALLSRRPTIAATNDPLMQCLLPTTCRSMATEAFLPSEPIDSSSLLTPDITRRVAPESKVLTTIYDFPSLEPLRFVEYPSNLLHLPLRRDLLHRAVIYEADCTRQGTASTKWRGDVHGSHRKIRPQKGTGQARLGSKQSPMLRGGGVAWGPKPRDFSTKLPKKIYDQAYRTALSYRYRRGELIIVQKIDDGEVLGRQWMHDLMAWNHWGRQDGRSMIVTRKSPQNFFRALNSGDKGTRGPHGEAISDKDVDVKDLLSLRRLIVEKRALDSMLEEHSSDLNRVVPKAIYT